MSDFEKVLKGLECCTTALGCKACPYSEKGVGTDDCQLESTQDALELLKARQWISVKDRLPDESEEYLVFSKRGYRSVLDYSTRHKEFNAKDTEKEPLHAIEVTHWMPLPEPPKEEP